jgi:hypothetical protein
MVMEEREDLAPSSEERNPGPGTRDAGLSSYPVQTIAKVLQATDCDTACLFKQ